jgi:hypothetical protein
VHQTSPIQEAIDKGNLELDRLFGPQAGPAVRDILVRAGTLNSDEIAALAARWRPDMAFLAAQAAAWKAARKAHMTKPTDFAYNAAYSSIPHSHPDWAAAANVAAHAALGRALGSRLSPGPCLILTSPWDEAIAPLPAQAATTTKTRIRKATQPQEPLSE